MVCLGLEPGVAEWMALTNPLSYGGTAMRSLILKIYFTACLRAQEHWSLV